MHIGVYTECLAQPYTGVEMQTHALVNGLREAGEDVECFHSADPRHPQLEGVAHHLFSRPLPVPLYHRFAAFFHTASFENVDVLHLAHPQFPYVKKPKVPVVVTVHDIIPFFLPEVHTWKRNVFFKTLLPWYLVRADAIIAVSNTTKSDIVHYYGIPEHKITVVYDCVPHTPFVAREKEPYIFYLGTLEPRKNLEGVIKAFSILKSRGFPQKLVIAGRKGWKYQSIFKLVKQLRLENDIVFRGYVTTAEKEELYRRAQVFVWPSFYEGFGLPVLEAMAHGTPVVTSNTSSLPEVAGDSAIFVNPNDPHDIARGISEVLTSTKRSRDLIEKGLARVKLFSVERMIEGVTDVYHEVMRR